MAIMSFAHLKPSQKQEPVIIPASREEAAVPAAGFSANKVMSFAHLKPGWKQANQPTGRVADMPQQTNQLTPQPIIRETRQEAKEVLRTWYRRPAVMPTALLKSVNYCQGCYRFLPATDWEKRRGNTYGRCMREDSTTIDPATGQAVAGWEVYKVIPADAPVSRCYFIMREK